MLPKNESALAEANPLDGNKLRTPLYSTLRNRRFVVPGAKPRIRIRAEKVRNQNESSPGSSSVRICVEDNGIGIPPQAQRRIFDMFQRATKDYEGTGIGLAVVRKVVERIGGKVWVESEEGKGSRFWVELKAADAPG